ncbi:hypothetical protein RN001_002606 [Aquatica leii]|uniref:Uncharacterized protein n=1 Tax=Aquatica leii TaxID=1421715 RepID=A0AAN7SSV5_9COLE|nr:hypothetical protein RN001_002606 [Aquatica leii]
MLHTTVLWLRRLQIVDGKRRYPEMVKRTKCFIEINCLKKELLHIVERNKPEKMYAADQLAEKYNHKLKSYANHEESDGSLSDNKEDEEYDSDTFTEETADADKLRPTRIRRKPNKYKDFHMSITSGYKYELDTEDDVGQERPTVVIKKDAGGETQIEAVVDEPRV